MPSCISVEVAVSGRTNYWSFVAGWADANEMTVAQARVEISELRRAYPDLYERLLEIHLMSSPHKISEEDRELVGIELSRLTSVINGCLSDPSVVLPPSTRLRDGTTGYFMRRADDCWPAAIATAPQIPLDQVPDLRLDERLRHGEDPDEISDSAWETIEDWLAERGLRMLVHRKVPANRRRWIGVVPIHGDFQSHCLVMAGTECLFDPAEQRWGTGGCYGAKHVGYGFSISHTTQPERTPCQ